MQIICQICLIQIYVFFSRFLCSTVLTFNVSPPELSLLLLRTLGTWEKELRRCIAAVMWVGSSRGCRSRVTDVNFYPLQGRKWKSKWAYQRCSLNKGPQNLHTLTLRLGASSNAHLVSSPSQSTGRTAKVLLNLSLLARKVSFASAFASANCKVNMSQWQQLCWLDSGDVKT